VYFRRHPDDDPAQTAPGRDFLRSCPATVRAKFGAVLVAVAAPLLAVVAGMDKALRTRLSPTDYHWVRRLGAEYLARNPRSVA